MTVDQIREALDYLESNYSMAMDFKAYSLAEALRDKIGYLREELIRAIRAEDPYTTEADIRHFEGWQGA
jgi:hypothetical protein